MQQLLCGALTALVMTSSALLTGGYCAPVGNREAGASRIERTAFAPFPPGKGEDLVLGTELADVSAVATSAYNLRRIGVAMHKYHDANSALPPAAVCDKKGKPLLSWRVLILPHIGHQLLYKQFKLDEPWDSNNNKKLLAKMPSVYAMPGKTQPAGTNTHYRVFVGRGAGFDRILGARLPASFPDGTGNTILCVTAATPVPWSKPDELEFDPDKDMAKLIGTLSNGASQIVMFDGSVRTLWKTPARALLNALITRDGGEAITEDF